MHHTSHDHGTINHQDRNGMWRRSAHSKTSLFDKSWSIRLAARQPAATSSYIQQIIAQLAPTDWLAPTMTGHRSLERSVSSPCATSIANHSLPAPATHSPDMTGYTLEDVGNIYLYPLILPEVYDFNSSDDLAALNKPLDTGSLIPFPTQLVSQRSTTAAAVQASLNYCGLDFPHSSHHGCSHEELPALSQGSGRSASLSTSPDLSHGHDDFSGSHHHDNGEQLNFMSAHETRQDLDLVQFPSVTWQHDGYQYDDAFSDGADDAEPRSADELFSQESKRPASSHYSSPQASDQELSDTEYVPNKRQKRYTQDVRDHSAAESSNDAKCTAVAYPEKSKPTSARARRGDNGKIKHFFCPLLPYGCTSAFTNKNEWKRHITSQHLILQVWMCDQCAVDQEGRDNIFNRQDLFISHLRRMHKPPTQLVAAPPATTTTAGKKKTSKRKRRTVTMDSAATYTFPEEVERCRKILRPGPSVTRCPFETICHGQEFRGVKALSDWLDHLGSHFAVIGNIQGATALGRGVFRADDEHMRDWLEDMGAIRYNGDRRVFEVVDKSELTVLKEDEEGDAEGEPY
ncbi:hypothetical protein MRB53_036944 [Persea americana]|nr:hypothetical protein MRB53_036944 [Persea americana]